MKFAEDPHFIQTMEKIREAESQITSARDELLSIRANRLAVIENSFRRLRLTSHRLDEEIKNRSSKLQEDCGKLGHIYYCVHHPNPYVNQVSTFSSYLNNVEKVCTICGCRTVGALISEFLPDMKVSKVSDSHRNLLEVYNSDIKKLNESKKQIEEEKLQLNAELLEICDIFGHEPKKHGRCLCCKKRIKSSDKLLTDFMMKV